MTKTTALNIASALLLSLAGAGIAQAATVPADKYGYDFRAADTYTDGARGFDVHTDGARSTDVYADGARRIAGLDRVGVSAAPGRAADPYTDGARTFDVYTDGARTAV